MDQALAVVAPERHVVVVPQRRELRRAVEQRLDHLPGLAVPRRPPRRGRAQIGDEGPGLHPVVRLRMQPPRLRLGEPPVHEAGPRAPEPGLVPEQGHRERVLDEGDVQIGDDLRRRRRHPLQQVQHPGMHVRDGPRVRRHRPVGQVVQMVALVGRQPQRPGQRRDHLLGRLRPGAPLQLVVVVHGRPGELGDLVPPQPGHPAPGPRREPHVAGSDARPPGPQKRSQLGVLRRSHGVHCVPGRGRDTGDGIPWFRRRRPSTLEA